MLVSELKGRDFLSLQDYSKNEIAGLLSLATRLKAEKKKGVPHNILPGKTLAMIFQKASTRTRVSFEAGMYQLGGIAHYLSSNDLQIGRGEPIKDTARVLASYVDAILIRTFDQLEVEELAKYSAVPVINGLTDTFHPTQVIADLLTIVECKEKTEGLTLAFIGDGNNMANSLMIGGAKMGMEIRIASPKEYQPDTEIVKLAEGYAKENGGKIIITDSPEAAAEGADVLYTDVWASMGMEGEAEKRKKSFAAFQVNDKILKLADKEAIVLHCLPAHRGEEITEEVLEGSQSVVFQEAENRLHAHKAILAALV